MSDIEQKASLKISQEVMEKIASVATLEVDGVSKIVAPDYIRGLFSTKMSNKPVSVKINDGSAEIDISLELEFGAKIEETTKKVQQLVKENVQTMTGVVVSKVNISVESIKYNNNKENSKKTNNEK